MVGRYKKEKKEQQPVKPLDSCKRRADEVENNVHCYPKKKKLTKNTVKKQEIYKSPEKVPETDFQWTNWAFNVMTPESPKKKEARLELPKKRWLREATMEQNMNNCRSLNQSRPTVLVRAGADSRPVSPPWTPSTPNPYLGPSHTSTPLNLITPVSICTPDMTHQLLSPRESELSPSKIHKDEELAVPLPSEDDMSFTLPLNLSQYSGSSFFD